ncbi:hypothetical protein [Desulfonatronovibrio hydrogenovorans]|uniref:hypothetical protein n=1 Tax=Desulfonatronovibrio hydrogenovorans TaxID=53245 RepID=UPI00048E893A|nr:hypothetical protein [Desulfonatronovibrio hydrogenovorans]
MQIVRGLALLISFILWTVPSSGLAGSESDLAKRIESYRSGMDSYSLAMDFVDQGVSLRIWQQGQDWRQEWVQITGAGEKVAAVAVGRGQTVLMAYGLSEIYPPLINVLFYSLDWWKDQGLDPERQSYHFFHGRPALALGMSDPDDPGPQLWLDNEELVPIRTFFSRAGKILDLGWLEQRNVGNYKLPHKLIIDSGEKKLVCQIRWREIGSSHDKLLFSSERLEQSFSQAVLRPPDLVAEYYLWQAVLFGE